MRRPGAARRAELEFSARANTTSAIVAAIVAVLAIFMVHDPGLTIISLAVAGWLLNDAQNDRNEADTINNHWEN